MKVLNFGSLNYDYVYHVDHHVTPGETLAASDMEVSIGGKGLNQSVALSKAGVPIYQAGMIGEDGGLFLEVCARHGIDCGLIEKVDGKSGHAIIQLDRQGQNCILLFGGSNRRITKEYVDSTLRNFEEGDLLILQNEINLLDYIIDCAYRKGMTIILNPSPYDRALESCDLKKISYFIINEVEGEQLTGLKEPDQILKKMAGMFPASAIVLTLGGEGAIYFDGAKKIGQKAYPVRAVDTTAAGDTFAGYFIYGLYNGFSIPETLELCAKAAAITVTRPGAVLSIPEISELV